MVGASVLRYRTTTNRETPAPARSTPHLVYPFFVSMEDFTDEEG
jgi:hypothetical protein